ncbi:hypothetical protein Tco_0525876 [Tanacetum coccineum]
MVNLCRNAAKAFTPDLKLTTECSRRRINNVVEEHKSAMDGLRYNEHQRAEKQLQPLRASDGQSLSPVELKSRDDVGAFLAAHAPFDLVRTNLQSLDLSFKPLDHIFAHTDCQAVIPLM